MEWISVKDRLPKNGNEDGIVDNIVFIIKRKLKRDTLQTIDCGCYFTDSKSWYSLIWDDTLETNSAWGDITHWLQLPELPKEG